MIPGSLNTMIMGQARGEGISHNWSVLSPFYSPIPASPLRPQSGSVGVNANRLVAASYGTGASWHGPGAQMQVPECTDFELSFIYSFVNNSGQAAALGTFVCLLQKSSSGNSPFLFSAIDEQAGSDLRTTSVSVNNPVAAFGPKVWSVTNVVNASDVPVLIRRESGVLTVEYNGARVYSGSDGGAGSFDAITIQFCQFSTYSAYSAVNIGPINLEYL